MESEESSVDLLNLNPRELEQGQDQEDKFQPSAVSVRSRSLLKGKALDDEDLLLCPQGGTLTALSQLVKKTEKAVHEARLFLEDALHELGSRDGKDANLGPSILTAIQLLHRTLDVWDLSQVEWAERRRFLTANDQLLGKTEELEDTVKYALHLFHQRERELSTLDQALKIYPQILVFRMSLDKVEEEKNKEEGEESSSSGEELEGERREEIIIKFQHLDMQFILIRGEEERQELLLKDFSSRTQTELVCIPIYQQIRTLNKVILNVDKAARILEGLKLCGLWELIVPPKRWWKIPKYGKLEKVVIALLVNRANASVFSISPLLTGLEARVGKCKDLVSSLHTHLKDREGREKGKGRKGDEDPLQIWIGQKLREAYDEIREEFEVTGGVRREYWSTIRRSLERQRVKE